MQIELHLFWHKINVDVMYIIHNFKCQIILTLRKHINIIVDMLVSLVYISYIKDSNKSHKTPEVVSVSCLIKLTKLYIF